MTKRFKFLPVVAVATSVLAISMNSWAQSNLPQSVTAEWKWMDVVAFNADPSLKLPSGTPALRTLAQALWAKEIENTPLNIFKNDGSRLPSVILLTEFQDGGTRYTFSIFSAANAPGCIFPGNGAAGMNSQTRCTMKASATDLASGKTVTQEFPDYCHVYSNDNDAPAKSNHTEVAIDKKKGQVHFRAIQFGKYVPSCQKTFKYTQ